MSSLTRWVLAHKRIVVALLGPAHARRHRRRRTGDESAEAEVLRARQGGLGDQRADREALRGTGGNTAPLVPVVTLPAGQDGRLARACAAELRAVEARVERRCPARASPATRSTGDRAFVSKDGRTAFAIAYPPPRPEPAVRRQPEGGEEGAGGAARRDGRRRARAPDRLRRARAGQRRRRNGPGVLVEALLGGFGALARARLRVRVVPGDRPDLDGDRVDHDHVPARLGADDRSPTSRRSCSSWSR